MRFCRHIEILPATVTSAALAALLVLGGGCGPDQKKDVPVGEKVSAQLVTGIRDYLEIDLINPATYGDANLSTGPDKADGTASRPLPAGGTKYIDWDDLGGNLANHRVLDPNDGTGKDPTSFPQSNECLGSSSVLSKMDLTYFAVASNKDFAYFAVQRANNNGDAAYYWLLTRKPPRQIPGQAPCKAGQRRLIYDLSAGDIMLVGHFQQSAVAALLIYRSQREATLTALQAVDFTNAGQWQKDRSEVLVAVNTTVTAPGAFGAAGVQALSGGNLGPQIFAEAAVPMTVFTDQPECGASLFGSVITRSSGSGSTSPDLKDFVTLDAPLDLSAVIARLEVVPNCSAGFRYRASATAGGMPLSNISCEWDFGDGKGLLPPGPCEGEFTGVAGQTYPVTVFIKDNETGCRQKGSASVLASATQLTGPSITLTPHCGPNLSYPGATYFDYAASVSGATAAGNLVYAWTFSGPGMASPASASSPSGSVGVSRGGTYTATVTVTDKGTPANCSVSGSQTVAPREPILVSIRTDTNAQMCMSMTTDAVTVTASATGGSGAYDFEWTVPGCTGASCTIDPSETTYCLDQPIAVTVRDMMDGGLCGPGASNTLYYHKRTAVTVDTNP